MTLQHEGYSSRLAMLTVVARLLFARLVPDAASTCW